MEAPAVRANDAEAEENAMLAANGQPGQTGKANALEAAQLQLAQMELQQKQAEMQQRQAQQNYGVKQFVEPGQTQGIPSRFIGQPAPARPPMMAPAPSPSTAPNQ